MQASAVPPGLGSSFVSLPRTYPSAPLRAGLGLSRAAPSGLVCRGPFCIFYTSGGW